MIRQRGVGSTPSRHHSSLDGSMFQVVAAQVQTRSHLDRQPCRINA